MDSRSTALVVIAAGVLLIIVGVLIAAGGFGWFGRLPGDLRWERENARVYFPLASMLIISVVLSLILGLLRRF